MPAPLRARSHRLIALVACLLAVLPAAAQAVGPVQQREGQGRFDLRTGAAAAVAPDAPARRLARSLGAQALVELDPLTGTARQVARTDGTLTGPSDDAPATIALRWLRAHADVVGLGAADLAALGAPVDVVAPSGTHHLRWTQRVDGVPVLGAELRAHVTADGRLLAVQGSPLAGGSLALAAPRLDAAAARARAGRAAGAAGAAPAVAAAGRSAAAATRFDDGSLARPVAFTTPRGLRRAWRVTLRVDATHEYAYVVDAADGSVLKRENVVWHASGHGSAWRYAPGDGSTDWNLDGWQQAPVAFPDGWVTSGGDALRGMNVHVYPDPRDLDEPDPNRPDDGEIPANGPPVGGLPAWNFTFAPTGGYQCAAAAYPCSWDSMGLFTWETNLDQHATQVFTFVNWFHDHLAQPPIGFDAASGAFEGGDPVLAEVVDGADTNPRYDGYPDDDHLNNANMSTPPDGQSPRMQMYLFTSFDRTSDPTIDGNGGDDASVVYHEYTHGLSSRLVTDSLGGQALNMQQSGAMGEGWSDWYAIDHLVFDGLQRDTTADGEILLGAYLDQARSTLRTEALDCTVGVRSADCPAGGYTYADYGRVWAGGPEVHADGEIWAQTLWDLRKELIARLGRVPGTLAARALVTDAMRLSVPEPSFLDMRNALLLAEQAYSGGAHAALVWEVFRARGMGYFATSIRADDPEPAADFSAPPAGAPDATLRGTVTDAATGAPVAGALVRIPGRDDWAARTGADGGYAIPLHQHAYPYLVASRDGYDTRIVPDVTVAAGERTLDVALVRNWALRSGAATVVSFDGPDYTAFGCGPANAIDGEDAIGWSTYQPAYGGPGGEVALGARTLVVRLPQAVDVTGFAIDPRAVCGDDATAALSGWKLETASGDGAWRTAATGTFGAADNGRRNAVAAAAGSGDAAQLVRLTLLSPQGAGDPGTSAAQFVDVGELAVYGTATGTPDPDPGPGPGPDPGPPAQPLPPSPPAPETKPAPTPQPAADTRAPALRQASLVVPRRHGLAALRGRAGLPLRVRCDERCRLSATVTIAARPARSLGLTTKRRGRFTLTTLAPRWSAAGRTTTLRVAVSRKVARRLARARRLPLEIRLTATDAAGNAATRTLRATLRR